VSTRSNTPGFCDESGVRSVVMQWAGRGIGLLLLLLCAGLALTLQSRVQVSGLRQLLPKIDGILELFHAPARRTGQDRLYLVVIQSVWSALYGLRLRWQVMRRSGEMDAVPVVAGAAAAGTDRVGRAPFGLGLASIPLRGRSETS
jgi:hypothetical protein